MGLIWGREGPGGPHVGPINFAIWEPTMKDDLAVGIAFVLFLSLLFISTCFCRWIILYSFISQIHNVHPVCHIDLFCPLFLDRIYTNDI